MKFEIKLYADELVNSISWCLSNEYSITCQIPLSYYAISDKNREINYNLVRNSGASIHQFLIQLNKAYHRKKKI
ncbi:MAG: hypothetical protein CMP49_01180 [Flavobacteriales bacterium]|nr:hypothetical protein [Flavobacteriales bacterium]